MNQLNNPTAQAVDNVLIYIFGFSLLLLLGITVVTIYFVVKYRRSKCPEPTSQVEGSWLLETIWTVLPIIIVMTMFWYGWSNYVGLREIPADAMEVKATARMWSWQFEYPDGRKETKLYVPVNKPVKVLLYSTDVLHSFFVPAFRIKRDTVPNMESYVWFQAPETGSYDIFCAEYCGVGHADMTTSVEVLSEEDYAQWASSATVSADPRGLIVLNEQGCIGCHSLDGTENIGPSLFELAGNPREIEKDGKTIEIIIDEAYLQRAIRDPDAEITKGFDPMMPAYDEEAINNEDLQAVVDYLLGKVAEEEPDGDRLMVENGCIGCHSLDGSESIAPTFKGIGQREVTIERDGQSVTIKVDAEYLRRALLDPNAEIVKGFAPMMPAADYLSAEEIDAIIKRLLQE
ncbi:cytochrome c oxidase subunit 2 [Desulfuromusa kysingii]|uniref:Cytochrome c oxidase subunit 2 n=1 Tax=Desulfuromusa kysingii TaxID=37625 RepID=A0A1H3W5M3_9BACT|nr:cytochrome c oxidase subunit II [Desulfuromusa kysingii]SDZ82290.1 cytochrome c oxidase subunit 2 [Desulfuromusa kysingii]